MKIIKKALPKDYVLAISGDLHLGCPNVSEEHITEMVNDVVKLDNCYMVNIGDNIEGITPKDKRFQFSNCKYQTSQEQADAVVKLLSPLKNKLLVIGTGNHEASIGDVLDVGKYISTQLNVPYGGISYKLEVYNDSSMELMHKMYFHHGSGSINSSINDDVRAEANMKASLKNKLLKTAHSDCIVMGIGHVHRSLILEPTAHKKLHLTTENGKMKQHYRFDEPQNVSYIAPDSRFYFSNPSFMKMYGDLDSDYSSYGERFMYSPSNIGYSKIYVENEKVVKIEFVQM